MWSEWYADDMPLTLPNTQLPPTRSDFSKQSNGMPRSCSALAAAMPEEPAPMTHAVGSSVLGMGVNLTPGDGGFKFWETGPPGAPSHAAGALVPARAPRGSS